MDQEVQPGEFSFFMIWAQGVLLDFQWRKHSVALADDDRISGSQTQLLIILDVKATDAGV